MIGSTCKSIILYGMLAAQCSGYDVGLIEEVNHCQNRLVLGWMIICGWVNHVDIITQLGELMDW